MITAIICAVVGLILGASGYYLIARMVGAGIIQKATEEAEVVKKNKIVEAKEKFIALKLEVKFKEHSMNRTRRCR